ncbi:MAG TPA: chemotaxis protein CheW [Solirubrobacteraceae bacterium]|nr:chemotaxis protein CheW [Solirubrobacteraceae bacterium]
MADFEPSPRVPAGTARRRATAGALRGDAASDPSGQVIVFRAAGELFALGIEHVREVTGTVARRGIPSPPAPWVTGIASIRGELMPVIDLALRLGHPPSEADGQSLMIVGVGEEQAVVPVAGVERLIEVEPGQLRPAPAFAGEAAEWIFEMDEHLVVVLRPEALLPGSLT